MSVASITRAALRPLAAAILLAMLAPVVFGQSAYFSLEGDLVTVGDQVDFHFDLTRSVGSGEDLRFQTFAWGGGTNAAGDTIPAGGIDSVLELFVFGGFSHGYNNDAGGGRDSLLTWPTLTPDPLPADEYRLNLSEFNNNQTGSWAQDLIGPADAMVLTDVLPTGDATVGSLKFGTTGAGTDVATFTAGGAVDLDLTGDLVVGQTGNADMSVEFGGSIGNAVGYIGHDAASHGSVSVYGTDASDNPATWANSGDLYVGYEGTGSLWITDGGVVSNATGEIGHSGTAEGTVTVSGTDVTGALRSTWENSGNLYVGNNGHGELTIEIGGRVTSTFGYVDNGTVTVSGTDAGGTFRSSWENSNTLDLDGDLLIQDGGIVTSATAHIGEMLGDGTVAVTGTDASGNPATWVNTGSFAIGSTSPVWSTSGELTISNGGQVSCTSATLGGQVHGSNGSVTVTGSDAVSGPSNWTNNGSLTIGGFEGDGQLTIEEGGQVSNTDCDIGQQMGRGTITVSGTDGFGNPST